MLRSFLFSRPHIMYKTKQIRNVVTPVCLTMGTINVVMFLIDFGWSIGDEKLFITVTSINLLIILISVGIFNICTMIDYKYRREYERTVGKF